jgi:hypothetical protein
MAKKTLKAITVSHHIKYGLEREWEEMSMGPIPPSGGDNDSLTGGCGWDGFIV